MESVKFILQALVVTNNYIPLFFYFTIYSFFGWLIENIYSKLTAGTFWKKGFYKGPFKPMYGIAPVVILLIINEKTPLFVIVLLCFLIPTIVEYVTGFLLRKLFKQQWWDYSQLPFQYDGLICLPFSLCWLFLSLLVVYYIHPFVNDIYAQIAAIWLIASGPFFVYFVLETIFAVKKSNFFSSFSTAGNEKKM